ncbi:MAG: hypothetical protein ACK5H2_04615, partial [Beutenbergiaceae bacterium]
MVIPDVLPIDEDAIWWSVPPSDRPQALQDRPLVVMLHGFGADELDLVSLVHGLPPDCVYASVR